MKITISILGISLLALIPTFAFAQYYTDSGTSLQLMQLNSELQGINDAQMEQQMLGPNSIPGQGLQQMEQQSELDQLQNQNELEQIAQEEQQQRTQAGTCSAGTAEYPNATGCVTPQQECQATFGQYAQYVSVSSGHVNCSCASGSIMNATGNQCVVSPAQASIPIGQTSQQLQATMAAAGVQEDTPAVTQPTAQPESNTEICEDNYGSHSIFTGNTNSTGGPVCGCASGYEMSNDRCVVIPKTQAAATTSFYVEMNPISLPTTTPATTMPQRRGFWAWILTIFGL